MRVALVHYWLLNHRGGEKVLEAICRIFPSADIFTLFYEPSSVSPVIRSHRIHASRLNPFRKHYRSLLPLMPMALEEFDLRPYDLIISSESGPAKGVLTSSRAHHLCYCHTPMRYLWELYPAYRNEFRGNALTKSLLSLFANYLRTWDVASAARVDAFMANSRNVQRRIRKTWRRHSHVVYPPVATTTFYRGDERGYSLIVSEMVAYKQLDYAVRAYANSGRRLKIAGDGPEYRNLRRMADSNIEFCGRVPDHELRDLYAHASEFVVPGEEDFGIATVEALAAGKPVVALGRGGSAEIVQDGCGFLYREPTEQSLNQALQSLERARQSIRPDVLLSRAAEFSEAAFEARFLRVLAALWTRSARRDACPDPNLGHLISDRCAN